jgi:cell division protein FtsL
MSNVRVEYTKVAAPRKMEEAIGRRGDIFPYLLLVLVMLTLVSVFHVWSRVKVVDLNLQLGEAGKMAKQLKEANERLRIEVGSLKNPARIEALATGELGMELPTEQQVVLVR